MSVHTGRLLLCPQDPLLAPNSSDLNAALTKAGFLGKPLASADGAYVVGDCFLQLLTFAGCSVRIALTESENTPFCHIRFVGPCEEPAFLRGRNTRPPRCPSCRNPLRSWELSASRIDESPSAPISCPSCGKSAPPWGYDWKEKAGFGRLFVQVEEVFPGEATPTPALLRLLEETSRCPWGYFYTQDH